MRRLSAYGAPDVNFDDPEASEVQTPLVLAILYGRLEMIDFLVMAGADLTLPDPSDGCIAVHVALRHPESIVLERVLSYLPSASFAKIDNGVTTLEMAIQYSRGGIDHLAALVYWADVCAFSAKSQRVDILAMPDEVAPPYLQALRFNYRPLAYALKWTPKFRVMDFSNPYVTAATRSVILRALYIYAQKITMPAHLPCFHFSGLFAPDSRSVDAVPASSPKSIDSDPGIYKG